MGSKHITYCRNCMSNCGMILEVEDDKIIRIENDRQNPISEGYACIKGTMAVHLHNGEEGRLTACMKRGEDGRFYEIDKYQAVDEIADKLSVILAEHGPRSLAMFYGTTSYVDPIGKPFAKSLMSELGSPNHFSTMTIDQSSKWVTAARMGIFHSGKPALDYTDVVLVAANNPLVSHMGYSLTSIPAYNVNAQLKKAKQRGVKFIVIDPRRTETARFADLFIQPYPGHDLAIFAAIIRIILKNEWHNKAFCDRYITNLDILRAAVEPFEPEQVAARAGIPPEQLEEAARLLGGAKKASVAAATGTNMSAFGNTTEHLTEALNAILGGYVLAGEVVPNPGIFTPRAPVEGVIPPNRTWEQEPKCHSADYGSLMHEFPSSIIPDEILTPGENKIRAFFSLGGNPVKALNDPKKAVTAFRDLDLLVCFDPRINATSELADYIIAPPLQFESSAVTTFTDMLFPWPFIQYVPPAKPAPEGTIGEWEFFWRLCKRMGIPLILKHAPFGSTYADAPGGIVIDMETMPSREDLIRQLVNQTCVTFDELLAHPHGMMVDLPEMRLQAPEADDGARLDLCPPDVAMEIASFVPPSSPGEGQFLFSVRRIVESFNTCFHENSLTKRRMKTNWLYMNPEDMAAMGLTDSDAVRMTSRHGEVTAYVRTDGTMKPGVVSMTHGRGSVHADDPNALKGSNVGWLISLENELQPINRMPRMSAFEVQISSLSFNLAQAQMEAEGQLETA
ncbi:MAG: hypothetical protein JWR80_9322 [Bradyrhizobium sp.]|nr:hypothetical protein [Bradyrhizobium sp.]